MSRAQRPRRGRIFSRKLVENLEQRRLLAAQIVGSSTVYATIQAAVDAATNGQTITVDPGTYAESVIVFKSLTIKGAKAGIDGRSNARASGAGESIVNGAVLADSTHTYGFRIIANNVTIDGFTAQDQSASSTTTGAGIVMGPSIAGTKILNNIVQNNVCGLYLSNNSNSNAALIQGNLFRSNNTTGFNLGRGIFTDGGISGGNLTNVTIDNNAFYNNLGSLDFQVQPAIGIEAQSMGTQSNIRITNNIFERNGKAVLAYNVSGLTIDGNIIGNHWDVSSAALRFEGGTSNVSITHNNLYGSGGRAIFIDNKASAGSNNTYTVTQNNIYANGQEPEGENSGLKVEINGYDGPMDATNNYWGSSTGPGGDGGGTGDTIIRNGANVTFSPFATSFIVDPQAPFWGAAATTDAPIQSEDFDHGLEGTSYHDSSSNNSGGSYRPLQGVDIMNSTDTGGGYSLSSVRAGEWIEYALNVPSSGTYRFDARVLTGNSGAAFHVEIDGTNVSGSIAIPSTSNAWQTISKTGISLSAGNHLMRLVFDTNNSSGAIANFNWIGFFGTSVTPPPAAPANLTANAPNSSTVNLAWTDNSNNESGFIIERKTGSGGTYAQIATTIANVVSYADQTVAATTTYFYRVRANSTAGQSANSNEASATTPAANTTYISDLAWVGTPTNGWGPVEKDASVGGSNAGDGHIITLNGVQYSKGLGTHADSEVIYNLGGLYNTFLSDIGVDDETGAGTVVFQVWGDNVKLYESPVMTQAGTTASISVPVAGVQQLRLVVNNGGDDYSWDHADWANARLVTASQSAPAVPSNLVATAISSSRIDLTWTDNANNETGFILERSLNGTTGWTQIATPGVNATSYSDTTGLSSSTQYFYRIRATNGTQSANSNVANATTLSAPAPAAPSNLAATAVSGTQINLTWTDNSNNETNFILERSLNGTSGWTQIATPAANATSYSDSTGLSPGTQYFYRIRATNSTPSADSNIANATTLSSSSVTYIPLGSTWKYLDIGSDQGTAWRATSFSDGTWKSGAAELGYGDGDEVTVVSFGSNSSNKFITTYFRKSFSVADASQVSAPTLRVKRDDGAVVYVNGTEVWRNNMPTGTIAYTTLASAGLDDETLYSVTFSPTLLVSGNNVIAVEIHQADPTSSDISFNLELKATVSASATTPAAPSGLVATAAGTSQINLTWTDNASNETGFIVERSLDGSTGWTQVGTPGANVTSFSDTSGLSPSTQYFYRVRATNAVGPSANSNVASATTSATPTAPAAPSNLVATASSSALSINLTWTDNANNESGFIVERSLDGATGWTQVGTPGVNATSFNNTSGLSAGTQYFYRVRATNAVGPSADSNVASATTLSAPAAPSNLAATAVSSSQINLTWTDGSNDEAGFVIERSLDGTTGWTQIATPAANATSYSNTLLTPLTHYWYRIHATNAAGVSADSNIADATTLQSTALPAPWTTADIGAVNPAGSAGFTSGVYTVKGSGAIGGTADAFRFVYQPVKGNGTITVRVDSIDNVDPLAMAGLMIRDSLSANARNVGLFVNATNQVVFTRRTSAGGTTTSTATAVTGPYWLRLTRNKNTITAYRSTDGSTWTTVGSVTITGLPNTIYIGLAVTSNKAGALATGTFSNLTVV